MIFRKTKQRWICFYQFTHGVVILSRRSSCLFQSTLRKGKVWFGGTSAPLTPPINASLEEQTHCWGFCSVVLTCGKTSSLISKTERFLYSCKKRDKNKIMTWWLGFEKLKTSQSFGRSVFLCAPKRVKSVMLKTVSVLCAEVNHTLWKAECTEKIWNMKENV